MDFESRLFVKPDAAKLLHAALSRPGYEVGPIALGTNTDPYQPIEEHWRVTRSMLELLLETRHPFTITTKSDRVLRDLDILVPAAKLGNCGGGDFGDLARSGDPPHARAAGAGCAQAAGGDPRPCPRRACRRTSSISPIIPQITDHELEAIVEAAAAAGARGGFFLPVRLPHEVAPLFRAWLDEHYPDRAAKVMATIRAMRGGKDNDPGFFTRMRGQGVWAELLQKRFDIAARRHGLARAKFALRCDLFEPPPATSCGCCDRFADDSGDSGRGRG